MLRKIVIGVLGLTMLIGVALAGLYIWLLHVPETPVPELGGQFTAATLDSAGGQRRYHVYEPEQLAERPAVVLVLHGSASSGAGVRKSTGYAFDVLADRQGFLVVYPEGFDRHWNDCRGTADYAANVQDIDDVRFFRELIAALAQRYAIDPTQVFVTGHSNGGHMAYKLAFEAPRLITAIAPISANLPDAEHMDCQASGVPVPVAIFNGTTDPINPHTGGLVSIFGNTSRGVVLSSEQTAAYWAGLASIGSPPQYIEHPELDGDTDTSVIESRWTSTSGVQVRLYTLNGSGHVVPSRSVSFPRILGGNAGDLDGPAEIMAFFRAAADR